MSINLNNSRRSYNIRCRWWKIKLFSGNLQKLIHDNKPEGIFYAREHQPANNTRQFDSDLVKIDTQNTVIETQDNVIGIDTDYLVEYNGELWIIDSVQSQMQNKRSQYNVKPSRITWISLRNKGNG